MDPYSCLRNLSHSSWLKLARAINKKMDELKEQFPFDDTHSELIVKDKNLHITIDLDGTPKNIAYIAGVNNPARDFDYTYEFNVWTNDENMNKMYKVNSGTEAVNIIRQRMGLAKVHFGVFELI